MNILKIPKFLTILKILSISKAEDFNQSEDFKDSEESEYLEYSENYKDLKGSRDFGISGISRTFQPTVIKAIKKPQRKGRKRVKKDYSKHKK